MTRPFSVFVLALVTALGGCSVAQPPTADVDVAAQAVETTMATATARVEIVTAVRRPRDDEQRFHGSGELDFTKRQARWVFEPGALPGMRHTDLGFGGTVEAVSDDLVLYLRAPLPGAARWLLVDLRSRGLTDADGLGGPLHGNDPGAQLHLLRGLTGDVEEVVREPVRGAVTTRYAGTADLDEAVRATPRTAREAVERTVAQLGVATLPVQAWIDDHGRVRRLAHEVALDRGAASGLARGAEASGAVATTLEYFAFGEAVAVIPPADDEVVTIDGPFDGFDGFEAERGSESAEA